MFLLTVSVDFPVLCVSACHQNSVFVPDANAGGVKFLE